MPFPFTQTHSRATLSITDVPTSDTGTIDCPGYYKLLKDAINLAPVEYKLAPISQLFLPANRGLWDAQINDTVLQGQVKGGNVPAALEAFGVAFDEYAKGCAGGGCATVGDGCNIGFYGKAPSCNSCYGGSTGDAGTIGNCDTSQSCDSSSGKCIGELTPIKTELVKGGVRDDKLLRGEELMSLNKLCKMVFQEKDGNIVINNRRDVKSKWILGNNSGPASWDIQGAQTLKFVDEGQLAALSIDGKTIARTKGKFISNCGTSKAILGNDCNFVIFCGDEVLWTWNRGGSPGNLMKSLADEDIRRE